MVIHLQKCPLCPLVVLRLTGAYLAVPIVAETNLIHLLAVACDVLLCCYGRVLTRLNGILLGRQTKSVVTHWVQDIKAAQTLVTRVDIRCDITQRVTNMQTCSRRIGEHIQNIEFGAAVIDLHMVGLALLPLLLPFGFDLFEVVFHNSFILYFFDFFFPFIVFCFASLLTILIYVFHS